MAQEDDVEVKFGADTSDLKAGIDGTGVSITQLRESLQGLVRPLYAVRENLGLIAEGFAAAFAVEKISRWVEAMAALGEQTVRTSEIFGITTEEVGLLNNAAEQTGGSGEQLIRTLERMSVSLQQTGRGATPAAAALKALGLNGQELTRLPLPDMLDKLREKFSALPDGLQKTAIAQSLVRNGAETLLPVLRLNDEEWNKMKATFLATGAALSGPQAAAFKNTSSLIRTMGEAFRGLQITLFSGLEPAFDALITGMADLFEGINKNIKGGGLLSDIFDVVAVSLKAVVAVVITLATAFITMWDTVDAAAKGVGEAMINLAHAALAAAKGDFKSAADFLAGAWAAPGKAVEEYQAKLNSLQATYNSLMNGLFGSSPTSVTVTRPGGGGGGIGSLLGLGGSAKDPLGTALADAQKQLEAIQAQTAALNLGTAAATAYTEAQKLMSVAEANHIKLSQADKTAIMAEAQAIGQATAQLKLEQAQQDAMVGFAQDITSAFGAWLSGNKSLGESFLELAAKMAEAVAEAIILDIILSALGLTSAIPLTGVNAFIGPLFGGGKAEGGPLSPGKWYIAGEHGPEPIWGGGAGSFAEGYGKGGGGDQTTHVHMSYSPTLSSIDSRGMETLLKNHGDMIAAHVGKVFNRQPSLRPRY